MKILGFKMGIKEKTVFPVAIILALALGGLAIFNYYSQVAILNREADEAIKAAANSTQNIINERLKQYQQLAALVAGMPTPSQAFAQGDRNRLIAEFSSGFEVLNKNYGVAQFQYHLPLATSFLRMHQKEKYGDDLTKIRQTVVYTNKNKSGTRGIEVGRGGLGLRGVMPVFFQGRHIGSVEFGGELAPAIDEAKHVFDLELGVLLSLTAESSAWPEWHVRAKKIADQVLFYSTQPELVTEIVTPALLNDAKERGDQILITKGTSGGKHYHVALTPLKDYSGKIIGYLTIFKDNTALVSKIRIVFIINLLIYVIFLAIIAWAINKNITKTVIDPIIKLTAASDDISMGKFTEKVEIRSDDEIQVLAKSIDRMRVSMKKMLE